MADRESAGERGKLAIETKLSLFIVHRGLTINTKKE
jgi:hypothetical protein